MPDMVEVVIDSVRVSLMSPQRIVVLRERNAERYLPIWVGPYEAEAIAVALQEVEMARPLTHDLLKNVFTTFKAVIERIEIVSLKGDVFYGSIIAETDGHTSAIDARPSDAIALAVRAHVPILVSKDVLESAGIIPERDIQQESAAPADDISPSPSTRETEGRLEVFEDFLKKLDKDKSGDDQSKN